MSTAPKLNEKGVVAKVPLWPQSIKTIILENKKLQIPELDNMMVTFFYDIVVTISNTDRHQFLLRL